MIEPMSVCQKSLSSSFSSLGFGSLYVFGSGLLGGSLLGSGLLRCLGGGSSGSASFCGTLGFSSLFDLPEGSLTSGLPLLGLFVFLFLDFRNGCSNDGSSQLLLSSGSLLLDFFGLSLFVDTAVELGPGDLSGVLL